MSFLKLDEHLTDTPREHRITHQGQAFFGGTGPVGAKCNRCQFWSNDIPGKQPTPSQKLANCTEYKRLMQGKSGPKVPWDAPACKYYQRRGGELGI